MSIFAFKTAAADTGVQMTVRNPATGLPMEGETITLLGKDSKVYRDHVAKRERALLDHVNNTRRPPKLSQDQIKQQALDDLMVLTIGWALTDVNGDPLQFSKDAARDLYSDPEVAFVREQVEEFVQDRANFLTESPKP